MAVGRLRLYRISMKYVRALSKVDDNVLSVSPQAGKASRPFVGIVVVHEGGNYCIPLSSPKPKHDHMKNGKDFSKIVDPKGKLIGVLNFNNMVPVSDDVLINFDMRPKHGDDSATRAYKELMRDQLQWCNAHRDVIQRKAERLYTMITQEPEKYRALARRCCDFRRLEGVLARWEGTGTA